MRVSFFKQCMIFCDVSGLEHDMKCALSRTDISGKTTSCAMLAITLCLSNLCLKVEMIS